MQTDWLWGLLGGGLIGTAAAIFLLFNGRIMGASGIIGGLVDGTGRSTWVERTSLIASMIIVPTVIAMIIGTASTHQHVHPAIIVVGGLLVGAGTRIANGCTSGHGVCGISRLSLRGIIATAFYIGAGGLAVVLFRHFLGVI